MKLKNILLAIISIIISLMLFEASYLVLNKSGYLGEASLLKRKLFFNSVNPIFKNHEDILLYAPNNKVRIVGVYYNKNNIFWEYDYSIMTNNFGLVQDDNLIKGKNSLLILGDSFTEGFGATPWFRKYSQDFTKNISPDLQPINGGILGTGFQQFKKLENYLTENKINVEKIVVVFISDDMRRSVFNLDNKTLQCVNGLAQCDGTEGWIYFKTDKEVLDTIDHLRVANPKSATNKFDLGLIAGYEFLVQGIRNGWNLPEEDLKLTISSSPYKENIAASKSVIFDMLKQYGWQNIIFVHIPQKDEINNGTPNLLGKIAISAIQESGAQYYDGFKNCNLRKKDFFVHDTHPNTLGYEKISNCVLDATKKIFK